MSFVVQGDQRRSNRNGTIRDHGRFKPIADAGSDRSSPFRTLYRIHPITRLQSRSLMYGEFTGSRRGERH